jgi:hypothetical protein
MRCHPFENPCDDSVLLVLRCLLREWEGARDALDVCAFAHRGGCLLVMSKPYKTTQTSMFSEYKENMSHLQQALYKTVS